MGGRGSGIAGNPVLIGAATVLVVLVAVFLSYNANQGLPFVPDLRAQGADAERRQPRARQRGADRRHARRLGRHDRASSASDDGTSIAVLGLKLERSVEPLPKDSTVLIRPRSALGLKYVELTRGTSDEGFEDGDTIPLAQATPAPVEFDEFMNMFDEDTRDAAQTNLRGLRRRVRRPRPEHQPGDRRVPAAAARHHPGRAEPVQHGDRTCRASSASWPTPRASSRPPPRRRRSCSSTSTRTFARAARGRAAVHPGVDLRGPGDARRGDRGLPRPAAVPGQHRGPVPRAAARASRALRGAAPDLADALEVGTPTLLRTPPFNRAARVAADRARDVRRGPARAARHPPPDRHGAAR